MSIYSTLQDFGLEWIGSSRNTDYVYLKFMRRPKGEENLPNFLLTLEL